jgi:hypothetical protein
LLPNEQASWLRDAYPLLVGGGVILAIIPVGVMQSLPQKLPISVRRINEWLIDVAAFCAILACFISMFQVSFASADNTGSAWGLIPLIMETVAFASVVLAYIVPFCSVLIPRLWRHYFYGMLKDEQSSDQRRLEKLLNPPNQDAQK